VRDFLIKIMKLLTDLPNVLTEIQNFFIKVVIERSRLIAVLAFNVVGIWVIRFINNVVRK
jgi:hypothetical protein